MYITDRARHLSHDIQRLGEYYQQETLPLKGSNQGTKSKALDRSTMYYL